MRFVIQIADEARVDVEGKTVGKIGQGYLVFVGIGEGDTKEIADKMIKKMIGLRIFKDENDKINLSIKDVSGEMLLVSQFTLYADCKKGNRPNFIKSASPDIAEGLFNYIVDQVKSEIEVVETGVFGAHMSVSLVNNGPFTIVLDSDEILRSV